MLKIIPDNLKHEIKVAEELVVVQVDQEYQDLLFSVSQLLTKIVNLIENYKWSNY